MIYSKRACHERYELLKSGNIESQSGGHRYPELLSSLHKTQLPQASATFEQQTKDHKKLVEECDKELKTILDDIPCVGEISREGKDAAGKLLESEFYYVPEMDVDVNCRETVTQSLGKTSIRAARKQTVAQSNVGDS